MPFNYLKNFDANNADPIVFNQNQSISNQINSAITSTSEQGGGVVYISKESLGQQNNTGDITIDFTSTIHAKDNVTLYIGEGVTLKLTEPVGIAYSFDNTSYAGLAGSGTLDVNGNAIIAVQGTNVDTPYVGGGRVPGEEIELSLIHI